MLKAKGSFQQIFFNYCLGATPGSTVGADVTEFIALTTQSGCWFEINARLNTGNKSTRGMHYLTLEYL